MKKLSVERKRKIKIFIVKTIIFLAVGLTIWFVSNKKHHGTEKDVGENIVADEIEEVTEIALA